MHSVNWNLLNQTKFDTGAITQSLVVVFHLESVGDYNLSIDRDGTTVAGNIPIIIEAGEKTTQLNIDLASHDTTEKSAQKDCKCVGAHTNTNNALRSTGPVNLVVYVGTGRGSYSFKVREASATHKVIFESSKMKGTAAAIFRPLRPGKHTLQSEGSPHRVSVTVEPPTPAKSPISQPQPKVLVCDKDGFFDRKTKVTEIRLLPLQPLCITGGNESRLILEFIPPEHSGHVADTARKLHAWEKPPSIELPKKGDGG